MSRDAPGFPGISGRGVHGGATAEAAEKNRQMVRTRALLNGVEH